MLCPPCFLHNYITVIGKLPTCLKALMLAKTLTAKTLTINQRRENTSTNMSSWANLFIDKFTAIKVIQICPNLVLWFSNVLKRIVAMKRRYIREFKALTGNTNSEQLNKAWL